MSLFHNKYGLLLRAMETLFGNVVALDYHYIAWLPERSNPIQLDGSIVYVSLLQTMGYNLLIIGHSLGAGVAALIAFLLREQYPQLYCYSYSPPGGLLRSVNSN